MKTIHIDYGYLLKIYNEFKAGVVKEQKSIQKEIAEMLAKEICEDLKNAYEKIINDWYSSYSPMFYNRKNTLEKAAKITSNGSVITIDINSDPLGGHRLENDKLYNLTMRQGYHGGGWHNGTPMYRGPVPGYYIWIRPAEKSFSPVEAMKSYLDSYQYQSLNGKMQKVEAIFRKHYSKYEYFRLFF